MLARLLLIVALLPLPALARHHGHRQPRSCAASCTAKPLYAAPKEPDAIDQEVLQLCPAAAGDRVEPDVIREFFARHLDDQRLIQAVSSAAPFAKSKPDRAAWLAGIWSGPARRNAFTHVLCGDDLDREKLGGLHLEARYAQLEHEGKICYGGPARGGQPCSGGQCLITFRGVQGFSCAVKDMGGFAQGLDALDLLIEGTRAYQACCMNGTTVDAAGRLRDGGKYAGTRGLTFQIWCGERNGAPGIATFYPVPGPADCR